VWSCVKAGVSGKESPHWLGPATNGGEKKGGKETEQERLFIISSRISFWPFIGLKAIRSKYGFSSHFWMGMAKKFLSK
jgi:hypothetical protein